MPAGDPPLTLRELAGLPVDRLRGVGPKRADALRAAGITSLLDLIQHYPRRYLDRTRQASIDELTEGEEATVLGEVLRVSTRRIANRRTLTNVKFGDATGRITLTFFNQPWREKQLKLGMTALVHGKLDLYRGTRQMANPVVDLVGDRTGRIIPVYPQSEKAGLHTWDIAAFLEEALKRCRPRGHADPVPESVLDRFDFVTRGAALEGIHEPSSMEESREARRRLVFDELLRVQLELVRRKSVLERDTAGVVHTVDGELVRRFHERLPYDLTPAQQRTITEIEADLVRPHPMHRLLQGDVGAGKTLVAVSTLLTAVQGGYQGALMAPTEVLAEQHHLSVTELLGELTVPDDTTLIGERPLRVALLTGRVGAADRRRTLAELAEGKVDILIGTHALIQETVEYAALGVVVIDEQHRFGVEQRAALREKGDDGAAPDVLVMTATPIPRTAAMTVYGDLDVSVLDELPPGRTPIETVWARSEVDEAQVWSAVRDEVASGRQAYVVCPVIEESDSLDVRSAEETFDRLTGEGGELADLRVGLLHGRVTPAEKEVTMDLFRSGALDVLVATTVIEVGVDVPNATVMVVIDADRFGIAQLHQLRGRVGRAEHASRCFLVGEPTTPDGEARLEALVASTDGFELAEIDLELRGEGTIMGDRQKGRNDLKLASLRRDKEWVAVARDVAKEMIAADPDLDHHQDLADEIDLLLGEADAEYLLKD
jgi:ATP-dependent DNA helicase RecG